MELVPGNSNLICRRFEVKQGQRVDGHSHNYDHIMLVQVGEVRVRGRRTDNGQPVGETYTQLLKAGNLPLLIRKDWHHEIDALSDAVYVCVFASRDAQGGIVDFLDPSSIGMAAAG